ncbi:MULTISPECIES: hypothetical protein [Streptomyces]
MDGSLSYECLLDGAKRFAHKAMDDHARHEYDEFALHGGVAVERLAKAVLVSKNPIYIAEMRGSPEMLFHLGGHRVAGKVRTIGAAEALVRLRMLDVIGADRQLDLLIDVRNGVAHTTGAEQAKSLMPVLAQTIETLLADVDSPLEAFWERWTTTVRLAVDNKRTRVYRDVQVRIRQARHAFDDRFEGLPEGVKERALTTPLPAGVHQQGIYQVSATGEKDYLIAVAPAVCPACEGRAQLRLRTLTQSSAEITLSTDALSCVLCGLELNGKDEIDASGAHVEGEPGTSVPSTMSFSYGPTYPYRVEIGETHTG